MMQRGNTAIRKMSEALDCDYLFALGLYHALDEMAKEGLMDTPITERTVYEFGYMSTKMNRILSTENGIQIWNAYRYAKVDMERDRRRDKQRNYRERKRSALLSPLSPTPPIPPIIPPEKERGGDDITPCHTTYDIPQGGGKGKTKTRRSLEYSQDFLAFWSFYPRHEAKPKAYKAWQKLDVDDDLFEAIKADITRKMNGIWRGKELTYIPHASTYLNGRRWEDETEVNKVAKPARPAEIELTDEERAIIDEINAAGLNYG